MFGLSVGLPSACPLGAPPPLGCHARPACRPPPRRPNGRGAHGIGGPGACRQSQPHVDAAPLDLRGLRILVLIDHVLVDGQRHQAEDLGLDPCLAERGQVLASVPSSISSSETSWNAFLDSVSSEGIGTWAQPSSYLARRTPSPPVAGGRYSRHPKGIVGISSIGTAPLRECRDLAPLFGGDGIADDPGGRRPGPSPAVGEFARASVLARNMVTDGTTEGSPSSKIGRAYVRAGPEAAGATLAPS